MKKALLPQADSSFVYSCSSTKEWGHEQFVSEHILAYQISGETQIFHQNGTLVLKKGRLLLAHKNQFAKSLKLPATDKEYKVISLFLKSEHLKEIALIKGISNNTRFKGNYNLVFRPDTFLENYFQSLLPYLEHYQSTNKKMIFTKVLEVVELLLNYNQNLENLLFDFTEPFKIDIHHFMLKNYQFNAPLEAFARQTGRSLSAFKRDFVRSFNNTPAKWIKEKRLERAYQLLHIENKKPVDFYLDLGFENLSHFYTSFKQKYGVTPSESLTITNGK